MAAVLDGESPTTRAELLELASATLEEQLLLGDAHCPEALCPTTFGNAFTKLVDLRVLAVDGNPRDPKARVDRGLEFSSLASLWGRVHEALRG